MLYDLASQELMGEGVELQEYLTHDAHGGNVLVGRNGVKLLSSLADEIHQTFGLVGKNGLGGDGQELVAQLLGFVGKAVAHEVGVFLKTAHRTMIELGDDIAIEQCGGDDGRKLHPWHIERLALLLIL